MQQRQILFFRNLVTLLISALLFSCSQYQKIIKSSDYELKYKAAKEYFAKKDYTRAMALFEELVPITRGTQRAEEVAYYYAECNYQLGDYLLAGFHYKDFYRLFPQSDKAETALFRNAFCYFKNSPSSSLDQENTLIAIQEFQFFIESYPDSKLIPECNAHIDALRLKLETKAYNISKLYYNVGEYKAAIQSFGNLLKDFPDTRFREEAAFLTLKSSYLLAINSIESKKMERLQQAASLYTKFIDQFPKSKLLGQAESMYNSCNRFLASYSKTANSTKP